MTGPVQAHGLADGQGQMAAFYRPLQPVDTSYLRIDWPSSLVAQLEDGKANVSARRLAAKACKALGAALLVGKGEWGRGLFSDFGCYFDEESNSKPVAGHPAKLAPAWILRLSQSQGALQLAAFYRPSGEASLEQRVAVATVPLSAWTQDLMRERGYARMVAALILDALPAMRRFEGIAQGSSVVLPLGVTKKAPPKNRALKPDTLALFIWSFNPTRQLWVPHIVGSAKIEGPAGKEQWHLTFKSPDRRSTPVYAGPLSGPGSQQEQIVNLLADRQKTLLTDENSAGYDKIRKGVAKAGRFLLLNTLDSGYVGVRVGRELIDPSSAIIPPATVIGIIGEVRTGYLAGLRVYFDYVPRHGTSFNGQDLWVEWSRLVAGYNFGIDVPWLIDRLELAPKIGVWNVNSRLPYYTAEQTTGFRDLTLHNALSLGVEGAAVWERKHFLLRFWYARDISVPLARKIAGAQSTVVSGRGGVDALLKGRPVEIFSKKWRLSYLLFAYHEDLIFSQKSQQAGPFNLEFRSPYAGGGMSLAW